MAEQSTDTASATETKLAPGITDAEIADAAANPHSFSVEGLSQTNRSLTELIAADEYLRKRSRAMRRRSAISGLGFSVAIPPGPSGI